MKHCSLRSKRFRGVWEQRKTEERDFRYFSRAKNGARAKKRKRGAGERNEGTFPFPPPPPLSSYWLSHHFSRGQNTESPVSLTYLTETLATQARNIEEFYIYYNFIIILYLL